MPFTLVSRTLCTNTNSFSVSRIYSLPLSLHNIGPVFYKPYESQGQAWPITFNRLIWGVVIFLIFMSGNFVLKGYFVLSLLVAPLAVFTVFWSVYTSRSFRGLSRCVNLSAVFEVQRGEETEDVSRLRAGHPVTWSQRSVLYLTLLLCSLIRLQ